MVHGTDCVCKWRHADERVKRILQQTSDSLPVQLSTLSTTSHSISSVYPRKIVRVFLEQPSTRVLDPQSWFRCGRAPTVQVGRGHGSAPDPHVQYSDSPLGDADPRVEHCLDSRQARASERFPSMGRAHNEQYISTEGPWG